MLGHGAGTTCGHENGQARERMTSPVEDWYGDPVHTLLQLLVRQRVAEVTNPVELTADRFWVLFTSRETFDGLLIEEGEDGTTTGACEKRMAGTDLVFDPHHMAIGYSLQKNDCVVTVANMHHHGLADRLGKLQSCITSMRCELRLDALREPEQGGTGGITVALPDDEAALMKCREQPMNHRAVHPEITGQLGGGAWLAFTDRQQKGKRLVGGFRNLSHRSSGARVRSADRLPVPLSLCTRFPPFWPTDDDRLGAPARAPADY